MKLARCFHRSRPPGTKASLGPRMQGHRSTTGSLFLMALVGVSVLATGNDAHATKLISRRPSVASQRNDMQHDVARRSTGGTRGGKLVAARRGRYKPSAPAGLSNTSGLRGKIVVFPFSNDDDDLVSSHVAQLLTARGLEVLTGLRRVDSAEQYRDMATHLGVAAYVDGDVYGGDSKTEAIVRLRSGFTGRRLVQARFTDRRTQMRRHLSERLWPKLARPMARACADATRPRKRSRTLHINAGTPIETTPRGS